MLVGGGEVTRIARPCGRVHLARGHGLRIEERLERGRREVWIGDVTIAQRVARVVRRAEVLACLEPDRHRRRDQSHRRWG